VVGSRAARFRPQAGPELGKRELVVLLPEEVTEFGAVFGADRSPNRPLWTYDRHAAPG
jgi:hypothetical protein